MTERRQSAMKRHKKGQETVKVDIDALKVDGKTLKCTADALNVDAKVLKSDG